MKKIRFKFNAVVNFIIEQNNKILLMKRSDGFFKGGYWVLPAGHIDGNETAREATIRELKEELNIDVNLNDVKFVHVMHSITPFLERMDFYFKITKFNGTIVNKEKDKCDEIKFFDYDNLPPLEKMSLTTLQVIDKIKNKEYYSEFGFNDKKNNVGFSDFDKFSFEKFYNKVEEYLKNDNCINLENTILSIEKNIDLLRDNSSIKENEIISNIIFDLSLLLQKNGGDLKDILYKNSK